jgi:hypothetical protein
MDSSSAVQASTAGCLIVNVVAECTLPEKILLAAHQLEEAGQSPFSAEALIVSVWQAYPVTFGLKGYAEQYPDSNKVLSSIMGEKGLARRGWLVKVGQKLYTLSRDGKLVVRRLLHGEEPAPAPRSSSTSSAIHVPKDQDKLLNTLFGTTALEKFLEGRKQEWTFGDACRFWNITENLAAEVLDSRLDHLTAVLADLERQIGTSNAVLSNGRSVSVEDVAQLYEVHSQLSTRFSRHLTLLRNRAGRGN